MLQLTNLNDKYWYGFKKFLIKTSPGNNNILLMSNSGGAGDNGGLYGEEGTITGKKCPQGLYGTFCEVGLL